MGGRANYDKQIAHNRGIASIGRFINPALQVHFYRNFGGHRLKSSIGAYKGPLSVLTWWKANSRSYDT